MIVEDLFRYDHSVRVLITIIAVLSYKEWYNVIKASDQSLNMKNI